MRIPSFKMAFDAERQYRRTDSYFVSLLITVERKTNIHTDTDTYTQHEHENRMGKVR